MYLKKKNGVTLIENMIAIALLSIIVISSLGGFIIAKLGSARAKHRMAAMSLVKEHMEKEISAGYYFGQYYTFASASPVTRTIDGIVYTVTPTPYPAGDSAEGSTNYKTVGFSVTWTETLYGEIGSSTCSEQSATYIARHA